METTLRGLSSSIKEALVARRADEKNPISGHIQNRIVEVVFRCRISAAQNIIRNYSEEVVENLNHIIDSLKNSVEEPIIIEIVRNFEEILIDLLTTELKIPQIIRKDLNLKSNEEIEYPKISNRLPKFLFKFTVLELKKINKSSMEFTFVDFQGILRQIVTDMGEPFTHFTKQIAKKFICQNVIDDELSLRINLKHIEDFYALLFGSKLNFKFYGKINRFSKYLPQEPYENYPIPLQITLSKQRVAYSGKQNVMPKGPITILPTGVQLGRNLKELGEDQPEIRLNTYRNDNMVIIGNHHECDIRLPDDDRETDKISFILMNLSNNYYMVDVSKKIPCYFKIFDLFDEANNTVSYTPLEIKKLYSLAKTMTFFVREISFINRGDAAQGGGVTTMFTNDDEESVHSEVYLKFFEKPYDGQEFRLKSQIYKEKGYKTEHNIGSGGIQDSPPDIYIPKEKGISAIHAKILYDPNSTNWFIKDCESRNGTFKLLKNETEFVNKKPSQLSPVFGSGYDSNSQFMTFTVSNYTFFLIKLG